MKTSKRSIIIRLLLIIVMLLGSAMLTACGGNVTLDKLQSEYGVVVEGGGFEEGSTLVSNAIEANTEEGAEALTAISDEDYNKDGSVYIFDIYVTKGGAKVQPNGKVKVSVPLPNVQVVNWLVFHIKNDNSVENLVPTVADGKLSFETSSFSYFVIAEAASAEHIHNFGAWTADEAGKHYRVCACGEKETADCTYGEGVVTKEATHLKDGIKTFTCTVCGKTKEEPVPKTSEHSFGNWTPDQDDQNKHYRECACGEKETANCTYDEGVVTEAATHLEDGIKTFTCTVCGATKEEPIAKISEHSFGPWTPDETDATKHNRECECGEKETATCMFGPDGVCVDCGRERPVEVSGIVIVISGGTATFAGKEAVTAESNLYGKNATVYVAQKNDVLNVTLNDQDGRVFKHWASANGTIIPDATFSMLVNRSGYYYPVFEDSTSFSNPQKISEGNCEEGTLYMSANSKGDIKYALEFVNGGCHDYTVCQSFNDKYHAKGCVICGEMIFEEHTEESCEVEKEPTHTEEGIRRYECSCGHTWTESIPTTQKHNLGTWDIVQESKGGQYGKYRVHCTDCDYYEEYWYLDNLDFVSFIDGKMINYKYIYGLQECHDEYYYSYTNADGQKVYIWAFQYEFEGASNRDKG